MNKNLGSEARSIMISMLSWLLVICHPLFAQQESWPLGFGGGGGFGALPASFSAKYELTNSRTDGDFDGKLIVTAVIDPGYHIYAIDQPKGGPMPTKIQLLSKEAQIVGDIEPAPLAKQGQEAFGRDTIEVRKHEGQVVWTCPIKVTRSSDPTQLALKVRVRGQICSKECIPFDEELRATFSGSVPEGVASTVSTSQASQQGLWNDAAKLSSKAFRHENGHVDWRVAVRPARVNPGSSAELILEAIPDEHYHLYSVKVDDAQTNFRTVIAITEKSGLLLGAPHPMKAPVEKPLIPGEPPIAVHEGKTTWIVPIHVPETLPSGTYFVEGLIGYNACTETECDDPAGIKFSAQVEASDLLSADIAMATLEPVPFKSVKNAPSRLSWVDQLSGTESWQGTSSEVANDRDQGDSKPGESVAGRAEASPEQDANTETAMGWKALLAAFSLAMVAGFILNFMPCVLPVIGLKVAGFVQEGSGNPSRTRFLMLAYVAGIFASLMAFCIVVVIARDMYSRQFLWGEHFTFLSFRIAMTVLLFAMALSFLGVWEIPIPGFANSQTSSKLLAKGGGSGAFFKGAFSTVLATPCSGPFLGPVIAGALTQPAPITLTLFAGISLGMSLPYLVVAAYPSAISWLPKPGPWMDTFKQILAFPLLFTTVFFISQFSHGYRIAALTMLIGVWFSCWLIGRLPLWAPSSKKWTVWTTAILIACFVGWGSFRYLGSDEKYQIANNESSESHALPWQPYSEDLLQALLAEGKTVMIDFTADWCANCKTNLYTAIETRRVAELLERQGIVPLVADWTDESPDIKRKLIELKSFSIPVLAIYPAKSPTKPLILHGSLLESQVLAALEKAGPSHSIEVPSESPAVRSPETPPRYSSTSVTTPNNL